LKKLKIAIIGFGWLGHPLGKKLKNLGVEVVGTSTSEEKVQKLNAESFPTVRWNNKEESFKLHSIFENVDTVILNFPPGRQSDFHLYADSLVGVVNSFPSTTKFIFVSSTSVYPDLPQHFMEDDIDIELRAKENNIAYAEWLLQNSISSDRLTIIRMAGLVGDQRHPARFFAGRKEIPNGNHPVNLLFREDAISLIVQCIQNSIWGETINGCASIHPSKSAYYTFACEQFGLEKPTFIESELGKSISNNKSKKLLNITYQMDNPFDYWNVNNLL
jgi:nucleoside-diphosphate-sugar epimerase